MARLRRRIKYIYVYKKKRRRRKKERRIFRSDSEKGWLMQFKCKKSWQQFSLKTFPKVGIVFYLMKVKLRWVL